MAGCAHGPQVVTETKVEKIKPPEVFLMPRLEPGPPPVPDKELNIEDVINWYEVWVNNLRIEIQKSEQDKQAIRDWVNE